METFTRKEGTGAVKNLIELLAQICDEKDLKVTLSTSVKGGLLTGLSTTVGGLAMGSRGLLVGGIIGSFFSQFFLDDFKPVSQILKEMDPIKRNNLIEKIKKVFQNIGVVEIGAISVSILSRTDLKELALREVMNYINQDLGLTIA